MTLLIKEYIEKPLIVLYYIKRRMDEGLKTRTADIVKGTGLTKKAVYHHINDLEKKNVLHVIRENLKNIEDIRLTPTSFKELREQTLEILRQADFVKKDNKNDEKK